MFLIVLPTPMTGYANNLDFFRDLCEKQCLRTDYLGCSRSFHFRFAILACLGLAETSRVISRWLYARGNVCNLRSHLFYLR
jgi:hypothetical protein